MMEHISIHLSHKKESLLNIMSHIVTLLGNDHEISNYITAVTWQRPANGNRKHMFSVRSVPRCDKQEKLGVAVERLKIQYSNRECYVDGSRMFTV
jgi:hypothetical protein